MPQMVTVYFNEVRDKIITLRENRIMKRNRITN